MGIVHLPEKEGEEPKRRPRLRRPVIRVSSSMAPSRLLLVVALAIGGAEAPEAWLRSLLLAGGLIVAYLAGTRDGARDHALDLLRAGRDDRPARGTTSDPTSV